MNPQLITEAYRAIGSLTPLKSDCGRLCGAACCSESDAGEGMLLLPGEETLLPPGHGRYLSPAELPRFGPALLYVCPDSCDRAFRPLACRIFPLAPRRMKGGRFSTQVDARGRPVCPLARQSRQALDPAFIQAVEDAFALLAQDEEYARYLTALDALVREYARFTL